MSAAVRMGEFNFRESFQLLGIRDIAAVTSGPQAGAFSAIDLGNSELVVFRLPVEAGGGVR